MRNDKGKVERLQTTAKERRKTKTETEERDKTRQTRPKRETETKNKDSRQKKIQYKDKDGRKTSTKHTDNDKADPFFFLVNFFRVLLSRFILVMAKKTLNWTQRINELVVPCHIVSSRTLSYRILSCLVVVLSCLVSSFLVAVLSCLAFCLVSS
jgi:hypothetical protein